MELTFDVSEVVYPTSRIIAVTKNRFRLFGGTGIRPYSTVKSLRSLNKIRDISVLSFIENDRECCLVVLVKENHEIYKNLNILKEVKANYSYVPVRLEGSDPDSKVIDRSQIRSVGILLKWESLSELENFTIIDSIEKVFSIHTI